MVQCRWSKIGKQIIKNKGPLDPDRMKTIDNEFLRATFAFMDSSNTSMHS